MDALSIHLHPFSIRTHDQLVRHDLGRRYNLDRTYTEPLLGYFPIGITKIYLLLVHILHNAMTGNWPRKFRRKYIVFAIS